MPPGTGIGVHPLEGKALLPPGGIAASPGEGASLARLWLSHMLVAGVASGWWQEEEPEGVSFAPVCLGSSCGTALLGSEDIKSRSALAGER